MVRPSGDHCGSESSPVAGRVFCVTCRIRAPSLFITWMPTRSIRSSTTGPEARVKAICRPPGDQAGEPLQKPPDPQASPGALRVNWVSRDPSVFTTKTSS